MTMNSHPIEIKDLNRENKYAKNHYNGTGKPFLYRFGSGNVLLTAVHSVNQTRDQQPKHAECYTGTLVEILSTACGQPCLTKTHHAQDDANFDPQHPMKDKIKSLVQELNVGLLLDIHGASEDHGFDIEVGTAFGINTGNDPFFEQGIQFLGKTFGIENITLNTRFPASGEHTVASHIFNQTGVPAMQLEISRKYRNPLENPGDFEKLLIFLKALIGLYQYYICHKETYLDQIQCGSPSKEIKPINRMECPKRWLEDHGVHQNDHFQLRSITGQCESFKVSISPDEDFHLTLRYEKTFKEAVAFRMEAHQTEILKPRVETINHQVAYVSPDIAKSLKGQAIEIVNLTENRRLTITAELYPFHEERTDKIWLSYYQRRLLGLELGDTIDESFYQYLVERNQLGESRGVTAEPQEAAGMYQLKHHPQSVQFGAISKMFRTQYCQVQWHPMERTFMTSWIDQWMDHLVKKNHLLLLAARGLEKDDGVYVARVTQSTLSFLGIDEGDEIRVRYKNNTAVVKAYVSGDDSEKLSQNNRDLSETMEYMICLPAKIRYQLGIHDTGACVEVERNTAYVFAKNLNTQVISIIGIVIAVFQLPIENTWTKIFLSTVAIPSIMMVVMTFERKRMVRS